MEENKENASAWAIISLVLGILSALSLAELLLGIPSIFAIIFSIIALNKIKTKKQKGKKIAIAGLILGIIFTMNVGIKTFFKYNNYFQDVNIENFKKDEKLNYCAGGTTIICNQYYSCVGGQIMSCMGGISMPCTGGNWNLGTTCIHGSTIPHTYKNPCQHGQTISHTYTKPCIHGFNYAHNQPCSHGFTYTHNFTRKCEHGYEKGHYYK